MVTLATGHRSPVILPVIFNRLLVTPTAPTSSLIIVLEIYSSFEGLRALGSTGGVENTRQFHFRLRNTHAKKQVLSRSTAPVDLLQVYAYSS